jgi:hypothetical protein
MFLIIFCLKDGLDVESHRTKGFETSVSWTFTSDKEEYQALAHAFSLIFKYFHFNAALIKYY